MDQELIDEFAANDFILDDKEVAKQCASLCASFDLSPSEFVKKWELFYLNSMLDGGNVLQHHLDNFRQFIQNDQRDAFRRKNSDFHYYSKDDVDMLLAADNEEQEYQITPAKRNTRIGNSDYFRPSRMDVDEMTFPKTPGSITRSARKIRSRIEASSPATPFNQRSSKLRVQFVLNKELPEAVVSEPSPLSSEDDILHRLRPIERLDLCILNEGVKPGRRYMFDKTEARFNALEKRIKWFSEILAENEGINIKNQVYVASQDRVFVVGMVCCDGEGHLNDKSVLLQGSVEHSSGHRVRLDLNTMERFSLFPGQIIGVEGHNPSGHCLVVSRIVDSIPMPVPSETLEPQAKRQVLDVSVPTDAQTKSKPLSMIVAAGPFTTSDNLTYEPLLEILDYARKKQPNLLILMGPFVDSDHPQIKLGTVDRTFHEIFHEEIRTRIEDYCEEMGNGARVLLVPSVRDAHHDYVFPQPAFSRKDFNDPDQQITMLGNPGLFSLNELTIGCCTVDVLRHLSSEEAARVPAGASSDRLGRLACHIISQRSFYPLFPAASGVPLDLSLSAEALQLPIQPDILIIPSDLSPFAKILSLSADQHSIGRSTLCINPGRLAKGMYGGTFSDILTVPMPDSKSQWPDQARVSIIKL